MPMDATEGEEHRNLALSEESAVVLHSMRQVSRLSEEEDAEREIAQLLSPPQVASHEAEELAHQVEESNAQQMAPTLKIPPLQRERPFDLGEAQVSRPPELTDSGDAEEQVRMLRIDMAFAPSSSTAKAEKGVRDSSGRAEESSSLIEEIKRVDCAMKLQMEQELETAASDVDALQNEIKAIRAMNRKLHAGCSTEGRTEKKEENSSLQSAKGELAAAKEELQSLREEGFELMSEMDEARRELQQIAEQKEKSSRMKNSSDSMLEHINHELCSSRSNLVAASFSEKRAEAIVSNILAALQQLHVDIEAAKTDTEATCEAIKAAKIEIEKTKQSVSSMEQRLQSAMRDLKEGIAFEDLALMKLRTITESSSLYKSSMDISKFEYYYLVKQAKTAQEIADQKVAAARAWIEPPTAEAANQRRLSILRKGHVYVPRRSIETKVSPHDLNFKLAIAMPRRSVTVNRVSGTYRRTRSRRGSMSSGRQPPTVVSSHACLAGSTRKNIMLKIVRFLGGGSGSGNQL